MEEKKRDYGRDKSAVSRRARKEKIEISTPPLIRS